MARAKWTRGRGRARRGSATVEFAILAPLLVVLVLWSNYFWELQRVKIKAAEAARFIAFERTVRPNINQIASEAQARFKDLDGSTKDGELGITFRNRLTLSVVANDADGALVEDDDMQDASSKGGIGGVASAAMSVLGGTSGAVAKAMGLDPAKGGVSAEIHFKIENGIIPESIALYTTGFSDGSLDVNLDEKFYLIHDTWRAWGYGDVPSNSYPRVQQIVHDRSSRIVYAGLTNAAGGVMDAIGAVLSVLQIDFPFSTSYVRDSILIRKVKDDGRYPAAGRPTRTVPGDALQAAYWKNDTQACYNNCEPKEIKQKRGLTNSSDYGDNWPMRSYNCRGNFFQGARNSTEPESVYSQEEFGSHNSYFTYGNTACTD